MLTILNCVTKMERLYLHLICFVIYITEVFTQDNAYAPPPSIINQMTIKSNTTGYPVVMTCRYKDKRSTTAIQWIKADVPLLISQGATILPYAKQRGLGKYTVKESSDGEIFMSKLTIADTTKTDEGRYRCILKTDDVTTKEWPKRDGILSLLEFPKVTEVNVTGDNIQRIDERYYVQKGSHIKLLCLASGRPIPTIKWTSEYNTELGNSSRAISEIELKNVTGNISGHYTCTGSNGLGKASSRSIFIGVYGSTKCQKPILSNNNCFKYSYKALTIEFIVSGFLSPNITWYRRLQNGTEIVLVQEEHTGIESSDSGPNESTSLSSDWDRHVFQFHISQFTTEDIGEYRYEAQNIMGSCSVVFNITISDVCEDSDQMLYAQRGNTGSTVLSVSWIVTISSMLKTL